MTQVLYSTIVHQLSKSIGDKKITIRNNTEETLYFNDSFSPNIFHLKEWPITQNIPPKTNKSVYINAYFSFAAKFSIGNPNSNQWISFSASHPLVGMAKIDAQFTSNFRDLYANMSNAYAKHKKTTNFVIEATTYNKGSKTEWIFTVNTRKIEKQKSGQRKPSISINIGAQTAHNKNKSEKQSLNKGAKITLNISKKNNQKRTTQVLGKRARPNPSETHKDLSDLANFLDDELEAEPPKKKAKRTKIYWKKKAKRKQKDCTSNSKNIEHISDGNEAELDETKQVIEKIKLSLIGAFNKDDNQFILKEDPIILIDGNILNRKEINIKLIFDGDYDATFKNESDKKNYVDAIKHVITNSAGLKINEKDILRIDGPFRGSIVVIFALGLAVGVAVGLGLSYLLRRRQPTTVNITNNYIGSHNTNRGRDQNINEDATIEQ